MSSFGFRDCDVSGAVGLNGCCDCSKGVRRR